MKKFECPFKQTSEYDGKCKNCSFQLMCTVKENFPKLYVTKEEIEKEMNTNVMYYPANNQGYKGIPIECDYIQDYCATFYTGSNPTEYYYVTYRGGQVECDKMAYLKDSDDWFLKKTLKENKIKKFFKKVFRGYYIFK